MSAGGLHKLTLERPIAAKPEAVFDAVLDPQRVGRWMFRTPGGALDTAELAPEVGGTFHDRRAARRDGGVAATGRCGRSTGPGASFSISPSRASRRRRRWR